MKFSRHTQSALAALLAGSALVACNSGDFGSSDEAVGSLGLNLTVSGYTVSQVDIAITSENLTPAVARARSINVTDPNATLSATEGGLPAGNYAVKLSAKVVDDPATTVDESKIPCTGTKAAVAVQAGKVTKVSDLVLVCTVDGGQIQTAGSINIDAKTETDVINDCGDQIGQAFVGPLDTSVGASVQLSATPAASNVTVAWSASRGTISADGTSYTCPATPGVYTVQAVFQRDAECKQTISQAVSCHNSYSGAAAALPSSFEFTGSCSMTEPCFVTQKGKAFEAVCGNRPDRLVRLTGEATDADSFAFYASNGSVCQGDVVNGELVGTCADSAGVSCTYSTDASPALSLSCPMVDALSNVTTCRGTYPACDVIQSGCNILAKCGDTYLGRSVNADGTVRVEQYDGSKSFTCQSGTGQCSSGGSTPETCSFAATVVNAPSACEKTLPSAPFKLAGCGMDDLCVAQQQGCAWAISCESGAYNGVATATNGFEFVRNGESCTASVVDGKVVGSCGAGEAACSFAQAELAAPDASCLDLPELLSARGCGFGSTTEFNVIQDGCRFLGFSPSRQVFVVGDSLASGITFPGISAGWVCTVGPDAGAPAGQLWGECKRNNSDGTVSSCRDLTADQGARLVISGF